MGYSLSLSFVVEKRGKTGEPQGPTKTEYHYDIITKSFEINIKLEFRQRSLKCLPVALSSERDVDLLAVGGGDGVLNDARYGYHIVVQEFSVAGCKKCD